MFIFPREAEIKAKVVVPNLKLKTLKSKDSSSDSRGGLESSSLTQRGQLGRPRLTNAATQLLKKQLGSKKSQPGT